MGEISLEESGKVCTADHLEREWGGSQEGDCPECTAMKKEEARKAYLERIRELNRILGMDQVIQVGEPMPRFRVDDYRPVNADPAKGIEFARAIRLRDEARMKARSQSKKAGLQ